MVVVLIIGILLAIAVPALLSAQKNAMNKVATANLRAALGAIKTVFADTESYDFGRSQLMAAEPALSWAASADAIVATGDGPQVIGWSNTLTGVTLVSKSKLDVCFWGREDIDTGTKFGRADTFGGCDPAAMGGTPGTSSDAWNN